jgi:tetratricopeptide (TPR) repeat protein
MTSLYNKSELIKSKIRYNDILKDAFNDLSAYLKQFIQEDAKKKSKKEMVMVSSISISVLIGVLIFLWAFLSPVSKANLFMMLGMKKTALNIMQKHIAQEAENPQFHLTLGEIYEKIGRNKEAEYHYKIAMEYFKRQNKEEK